MKRKTKQSEPWHGDLRVRCGYCGSTFATRDLYEVHQCAPLDKVVEDLNAVGDPKNRPASLPISIDEMSTKAVDPSQSLVRQLAGEFVASTALSSIQADVRLIARRYDEQNERMHQLNTALGDFKTKLVIPLTEELKSLRYNMGAKVEQTTTELSVFVNHLNTALAAMLKSSGWSDEKIAQYREQFGLNTVEAPRAAEFSAYAEQTQQLRDQCQELVTQNQRLITKLSKYEARKRKRRKARQAGTNAKA